MNLKRDNWSNQQIIDILQGCQLVKGDGSPTTDSWDHHFNEGIQSAIHTFEDFIRDLDEFGASAYDPETKRMYQIGKIPE